MSWRRRVARPRKARKPAKARARKPAKAVPSRFRVHKGRGAGKAFRAHKAHHVATFRAHGKRKLKPHSVAHAKRVKAIRARTRKVRMRRARPVLSLIARR